MTNTADKAACPAVGPMTPDDKALLKAGDLLVDRKGETLVYNGQNLDLRYWSFVSRPAVITREGLIDIVMRETTDAVTADGVTIAHPNILEIGCRHSLGRGYEKPAEAARTFAGFIADAVLKALPQTSIAPHEAEKPTPLPIVAAPKDGSMLRLWVRYPEGGSWTPLDDARESWTIGFNNFDNTEDDRWQVVGWCWSHDHLVEAADDVEVLGWLPFHASASPKRVMVEQLPTDDGGCVTKRFVIFNKPGHIPEKKGGWLKDEHLIDFLREVMLHDGWSPGFRATVLELTWDNDLWASSASEYLSMHDHAIGPRAARKAWEAAREKHERIYKTPPAAKLGEEINRFHKATALAASSPSPAQGGYDGYVKAFYELAEMMGQGASPMSPAEVWERRMKPRLKAALSTSPQPEAGEAGQ